MLRPVLLLLLTVLPQDSRARPSVAPLESGLVRSLELEGAAGTWVQHLRLDRAGARAGELPAALLRYVAGPDVEGGVRVELEVQWLDEPLRVIHTEQASRARRRLVFREMHAAGGRTLFLEGTPEAGFQGYELGVREVVRHAFDPARARAAGEFPLLVIESARMGFALPSGTAVLEPLSAAFEPVRLAVEGPGAARTCEARRSDGSLRWRVTLAGARIEEWRFQERGPAARAISTEEFMQIGAQHELAASAAREAASARGRTERSSHAGRAPRAR
jgi:hypothetical protein